jgi:ACS family glucarate transporter-like MFS transporter
MTAITAAGLAERARRRVAAAAAGSAQATGLRAGLRAPGLVGLPLAALFVLLAIATPDGQAAALLLAGAAGSAALGIAPAWSVCLAIGGRHAGVVSGAMNTFGNLGGVASPLVVGWCLEAWGSWSAPLWTIAALYLAAAACWLGIDPERPLEGFAHPRLERGRT